MHGRQSLEAQARLPDATFTPWIKTSRISPFRTRIFAGKQLSARVFDCLGRRLTVLLGRKPIVLLGRSPTVLRRKPTILLRRRSIITSHPDAPGRKLGRLLSGEPDAGGTDAG
jgi:hypothetical protein